MSKGTASWMLLYPDNPRFYYKCHWTQQGYEGKSHWRKFINLCRQLNRTRCQYEVTYIDMSTHLRALVKWHT